MGNTADFKTTYWDSDDFPGLYQMEMRPSRLEVLEIIKDKDADSLLDVGCGTGPIYSLMKIKNFKIPYKGVDYSKRFIKFARKAFPEASFQAQDARKLKEEDGSWDILLYYHALDHIGDWQKAIEEAYRVCLRYTIIVLWRKFAGVIVRTNATPFYKVHNYKDTWLHEFGKELLEGEFRKAGFLIEHEEEMVDPGNKYNYIYVLRKSG